MTESRPIVLFDDHRAIVDAMPFALGLVLPQYKFLAIFDVVTARAELLRLNPALVIIDWSLSSSQTGGDFIFDLAEQLPETKWLLFTAVPMPYVIAEAVRAGVSGCVSKSNNPLDVLVQGIREVLAGRTFYCPDSQRSLTKLIAGGSPELTPTDVKILKCIVNGLDVKAIAAELQLQPKTVANALTSLRAKTGAQNLVSLARYAVRSGVAPPNP